jgi:hypothetical protein
MLVLEEGELKIVFTYSIYNTASIKSAHAMSTWLFHILIN